MAYSTCQMEGLFNSKEKISADAIQAELVKNNNDTTTISDENDEEYFLYVTFNNTDHDYMIRENGKIEYLEKEKANTSDIDKKTVEQEISYKDSLENLNNPDRGFYIPVIMRLNLMGFDFSTDIQSVCNVAIQNNINLIHFRINIGELSGNKNAKGTDLEFSEQQLRALNDAFEIVRENNLNAIVRFAYDTDGNAGNEPMSFNIIKKHIQQLSPFFEKNKDVISAVETGFLGLWGEMHDAGKYESDNYYKELIETLLYNTPNELTINVRTPHHYMLVAGELDNSQQRIGICNDGYLGSSTDLGTFNEEITRENFVKWMQTQGKYTLYGGETTKFSDASADDEKYSESSFAIAEMPKTHTSYLNSEFNRDILDKKWENQVYTHTESEYDGQKAYKYIKDHLGYRLVVRNSKVSSSVKKGEICGVKLGIENVGFGNIVKRQKVSVILRKDTVYYEANLDINAKKIGEGINDINFYFYVPSDIEEGNWDVSLKIYNKDNQNYGIKFANIGMWDNQISANKIGTVTIENAVAEENVKIKQAFSRIAKEGIKGIVDTSEHRTVQVKLEYYNSEINSSGEYDKLGEVTKNIIYGTTINFKDANCLSELQIEIPKGYVFNYAQCYAITKDWKAHDSISIPAEPDQNLYIIQVFAKEDNGNKIPVTFDFYLGENLVNTITKNVDLGTTIDFKDNNSLSSLGITMPDGYIFNYAQCYAITNDWKGYDTIVIPSNTEESKYTVLVFIKEATVAKIPVTFGFYSEGNIISSTTVELNLGTEIDFTNASSLAGFGITIPDGYTFNYAQCYAITNDWNGYTTITIPASTTESSFWINVFINK